MSQGRHPTKSLDPEKHKQLQDRRRKREGKSLGPKRREFDLKLVERLGGIGCTYEEMARVLKCSHGTVEKRMTGDPKFRAAYDAGAADVFVSIRREVTRIALDQDHPKQMTALIWLSKVRMGMSERVQVNAEVEMSDHWQADVDRRLERWLERQKPSESETTH